MVFQKDYKAIEDINNIDIKNNIVKFSEYDEENNLLHPIITIVIL